MPSQCKEQRDAKKRLKERWERYDAAAVARLREWLTKASYGSTLTFAIGPTKFSPFVRLITEESQQSIVSDIPTFDRPE